MRFSTKTLLLVTGLIALWLSTFAGYAGSSDVHESIMLVVATSAAIGVIYGRGKTQAFALAFFAIMLVMSDFFTSYNIRFDGVSTISDGWANALAKNEMHRHWLNLSFLYALIGIWTLTLATVAGFAATLVYEHCQRSAPAHNRVN
jgi:hypothetical protein